MTNALNAQCFTRIWDGNGLDQMNIYVTLATLNGVNLQVNDEIGIFDGDACVGIGVLTEELTGGGVYLEIKVSTDDPDTPEKDGFTPGNPISYKFCQGSQIIDVPVTATYIAGSGTFSSSATAMVELRSEEVNQPPVINTPFSDQNLSLGFSSLDINLAIIFSDPDGDVLTYSATNSNNSVVTATITGSILTLSNVGTGTTTIEVCASDGALSICDDFTVTVTDPASCTLPADWSVRPNDFDYNGEIVLQLFVDETPVTTGYLGAFVGDECRGVVEGNVFPLTGDYIFTLICYSNEASGEIMDLKYFDIQSCQVVEPLDPPVEFISDMVVGTASQPEVINSCVNYSKSFLEGWNWFSMNASLEDMSLGNVLSCATEGDYIKNQVESATYYEGLGWYGALTALNTATFYKLKAINICGIDFCGTPVNPADSPISIVDGWNWIGYHPQEALSIADALSSLTLEETDYIKNQVASATYYNGLGWYGALSELDPGDGFMMRKVSADVLTYPAVVAKKSVVNPAANSIPLDISFSPQKYEFSGNLTAEVNFDNDYYVEEDDYVLAYVSEVCRGIAQGIHFEPTGEIAFPFLIHSNLENGETISFKFYDASEDQLYSCNEKLNFIADMVEADAYIPFTLNVNGITDVNTYQDEGFLFNLYPNPVEDVLHIQYNVEETSQINISVFDITGRVLRVLENDVKNPGTYELDWNIQDIETNTLLLKFRAGEHVAWKRMIQCK